MSATGEAKPPSAELIEIMRKVAPAGPPPPKTDEVPIVPSIEEWEWSDGTVGQPEIPGWVEDTDPYTGDSLEIGPVEDSEEEPVIVDDTADLLAQAAAARKRFSGS